MDALHDEESHSLGVGDRDHRSSTITNHMITRVPGRGWVRLTPVPVASSPARIWSTRPDNAGGPRGGRHLDYLLDFGRDGWME